MNSRISPPVRLGITIGDPCGIGPALVLRALRHLRLAAHCVVIGDGWVLRRTGLPLPRSRHIQWVEVDNVRRRHFSFGRPTAASGRACIEYLDAGLALAARGEIEALVTCPISKEALALAGYSFSGHTEYLASRTRTPDPVMMLLNKRLKLSLVTRHVPLAAVSRLLDEKKLTRTILATDQALRALFGIGAPRIGVMGLNPHASDNGVLGRQENALIAPVVRRLKGRIPGLQQPEAADVAVYHALQGCYDALIAMYHDQALIALKATDAASGVNLTLGLPFVRTSPLHGTAFAIAATPEKINPASLVSALTLAVECTLARRKD